METEPQVPAKAEKQKPPAKTQAQKAKEKAKADMEEAMVFEQFGAKVMKVRMRAVKALGHHADALGMHYIGHGKILLGADNAEKSFAACGELVEKIISGEYTAGSDTILALMELQRDFNEQIIDAGAQTLKAVRPPDPPKSTTNTFVAFPPGSQAVVVSCDGKQLDGPPG